MLNHKFKRAIKHLQQCYEVIKNCKRVEIEQILAELIRLNRRPWHLKWIQIIRTEGVDYEYDRS